MRIVSALILLLGAGPARAQFTGILQGDGSALTGVVAAPSGAAGGDLGGSYPNPTIVALPAISGANLFNLNGASVTGNITGTATPAGPAGGGLSGTYPNPTISSVSGGAVTGNITGSAANITGNLTGSQVTGNITGMAANITGNLTASQITGNLTGSQITGNITGSAANITGNLTGSQVTGNITGLAANITGNLTGSQVTGNITGLAASITGNITGSQVTGNITGTATPGGPAGGSLSGTYPNPTITSLSGAVVTGNITGSAANITGNLTGSQVTGNITGMAANITGNLTGSQVTGNITGSANAAGAAGGNLSGTYPNPGIATLPAISGANLTALTAANISAGSLGSSVIASSVAAGRVFDGSIVSVSGAKVSGNIAGLASGAPPTGAAGGNLGGTYPNPGIVSLPAISGANLTSLTVGNITNGTFQNNPFTFQNTVNFSGSGIWDASGRIGIGGASPGFMLDIQEDPAVHGGANPIGITFAGAPGYYPWIYLQRAGGTPGSPSAVSANGGYGFLGRFHDGSSYQGATFIMMNASAGATNNNVPTYIAFGTSPSGSATALERVRIDPDGKVGIGVSNPTRTLDVAGTINVTNRYEIANSTVVALTGGGLMVGPSAGIVNTGSNNVFVGNFSGLMNTSGGDNAFLGRDAGRFNVAGSFNTALGSNAGKDGNSTGNTYIGAMAGQTNTGGGGNNTMVGREAGQNNASGDGNVFLGNQAGKNETGSNRLYIANSGAGNPLIYGNFSSGDVGIGNMAPNFRLDVNGSFGGTFDATNNGLLKVGYTPLAPAGYYATYAP